MRPCAGARGTFWTEKRLPLLSPGGASHSSAHSHLGGGLLTRKIPGRDRIKAVTGMGGCGGEDVRALLLPAVLCSASGDRGFSRNCER